MSTEYKTEFLALSGLINNPSGVSGPRVTMQALQLKQSPGIAFPDPIQFPTGNEYEYGKYMINDSSNVDGSVISTIIRRSHGSNVPLEWCLFVKSYDNEGVEGERIHIHEISRRLKHHETFASELELTPEGHSAIHSNSGRVTKGMSYNQTNSYKNGEWVNSVSCPTAIISDHRLIEDSYAMMRSATKRFLCWGYKDYILNLKVGDTLGNLWGTPDNPRYIPRVGDKIRGDGKVICKMSVAPEDSAFTLSDIGMYDPIAFYNEIHHNDGDSSDEGLAEVVDVKVIRAHGRADDGPSLNFRIPDLVQKELDTHATTTNKFYHEILLTHIRLAEEYGGEENIPYSYKARRIIFEAIARSPRTLSSNESRRYHTKIRSNRVPMSYAWDKVETYRVVITVKYPFPLSVSGKIADFSGTKGIISSIYEDEDAPIDENGDKVWVMRCCDAQLRRSTYLPLYMIYSSHVARLKTREFFTRFENGEDTLDTTWNNLIEFTKVFNDEWAEVTDMVHPTDEDKKSLIHEIKHNFFRARVANDQEKDFLQISLELEEKYGIKKTKLYLTNAEGVKGWTENSFFVGNIPTIRLDKHGREFSSVSAPRFDPFGTITRTLSSEGTFRPAPTKSVTWKSESEGRLLSNHGVGELGDIVADMSNNPKVADIINENVLTAPQPSNMEEMIDRDKYPLGNSRPHQMLQHIMRVGGDELFKPLRKK